MKKRYLHIIAGCVAVAIIIFEAVLIWNFAPKKPFKNLERTDIESVCVLYGAWDPCLVPEEEIDEIFIGQLRKITLYGYAGNPDPANMVAVGSTPTWLRIELTNGKVYEIQEGYPYASLNGKNFYTDHFPWPTIRGIYLDWLTSLKESGTLSSGNS